MFGFSETKRTMIYQCNLVIHPFQGSNGDTEFHPGQEAWEMIFHQPGKFDDRFQSAGSGPPEPLFQMGLGAGFLPVIPEPLEFFFEIIGPDDGEIEYQEMREPAVARFVVLPFPDQFDLDSGDRMGVIWTADGPTILRFVHLPLLHSRI